MVIWLIGSSALPVKSAEIRPPPLGGVCPVTSSRPAVSMATTECLVAAELKILKCLLRRGETEKGKSQSRKS